jgi:glycosyltransferase involved in cell wall biosynthesis
MKELSVVVASKNTERTIRQCLESLIDQYQGDDLEILVIDASTDNSAGIAQRFKNITLVQADTACLVPELWKMGIELTDGKWVAFTTANFIPAKNWIAELRTLIQDNHTAVGGVFEKLAPDKLSQWAIYFLRYSAFLPSISPHLASQLAADNAVYARWVFEKYADLVKDGFWEHPVNRALEADRQPLFLTPTLRVSMGYFSPPGEFFLQRFFHGRVFGAERVAKVSPMKRLLYILASPLIPPLLFMRVSGNILKNSTHKVKFFFSLPWILFYVLGWSSGELSGYLIRKPPAKRARSEGISNS